MTYRASDGSETPNNAVDPKDHARGGVGIYHNSKYELSVIFNALTESNYIGDVAATWEDGKKKVIATIPNDPLTDSMNSPAVPFIQDLMPAASLDWIYFSRAGQNGLNKMTDPSQGDDKIYSTSCYRILTEPIFNAIKDQGYSTRFDDTNGFWKYYTYDEWRKKTLTDQSGKPYERNSDQSKYYYASVLKILDTQDLSFEVGSDEAKAWNSFSNLTYFSDKISKEKITVNASSVDVATPGTYYYAIDDDHIVSKTGWVTVTEPNTPPADPVTPADNDNDDKTPSDNNGSGQDETTDPTDDQNGSDDADSDQDQIKTPQTGDETNLSLWSTIMGLAAAAAGAMAFWKKARR